MLSVLEKIKPITCRLVFCLQSDMGFLVPVKMKIYCSLPVGGGDLTICLLYWGIFFCEIFRNLMRLLVLWITEQCNHVNLILYHLGEVLNKENLSRFFKHLNVFKFRAALYSLAPSKEQAVVLFLSRYSFQSCHLLLSIFHQFKRSKICCIF